MTVGTGPVGTGPAGTRPAAGPGAGPAATPVAAPVARPRTVAPRRCRTLARLSRAELAARNRRTPRAFGSSREKRSAAARAWKALRKKVRRRVKFASEFFFWNVYRDGRLIFWLSNSEIQCSENRETREKFPERVQMIK